MSFRTGNEVTVVRSTSDPANTNDANNGALVGQRWVNTATLNEFTCMSNGAGAAVWRHTPRVWQGNNLSVPADTTEDVLATVSLAAGVMGVNGALECYSLWSYTNSVNNKTMRARLGGIGGTQVFAVLHTTTTMFADLRVVANQGAANVQAFYDRGSNSVGSTTGTNNSATIDTSALTTLVFTGQKASSGETLTLAHYKVTLTRPDII
jgi:hypothetical protein